MTLREEQVKEIAEFVAEANSIPYRTITTTTALNSSGTPVVEVTVSIAPDPSSFEIFKDGRSSRMVSEFIKKVADTGEDKIPMIHFEGSREPGS